MNKLSGIEVRWNPGEAMDLFGDDEYIPARHGVLTTEHAASSYGIPVLVGDDGQVYGAAEMPFTLDAGTALRSLTLVELMDAGSDPTGAEWDPEEMRETVRLIQAALSAGYRITGIR